MPTQNYAPYIEAPYSVAFLSPNGQYMTGDERTQVCLKSLAINWLNLVAPLLTSETGGPLAKGPNPMKGVRLVLVQLDGTDQSTAANPNPIWTSEKPAVFGEGTQVDVAPMFSWVPLDSAELKGNGQTSGLVV